MSAITEASQQADFAQAAYATVTKGMVKQNYIDALVNGAKMSQSQAKAFAAEWTVVDSAEFDNGAAATIFKNKNGVCYLAIRGTEDDPVDPNDYAADAFLAAGFPSYTNPQFWSLEDQVQEWINDGDLPASFTVTGHSLGGYLAAPGC